MSCKKRWFSTNAAIRAAGFPVLAIADDRRITTPACPPRLAPRGVWSPVRCCRKYTTSVRVEMSAGSFGSTMKRTGMRRASPDRERLLGEAEAFGLVEIQRCRLGAMLGTALPTIALGIMLRASNQASVSTPGCTFIITFSGANCHFSALLTLPTNCTSTRRLSSSAKAATLPASAALFSKRMPNTCSQAMR